MSLFADSAAATVLRRWVTLRDALGFATTVHARQVHGANVLLHDAIPAGIHISPDADGHVTTQAGLLLAVSVADCVPVYLMSPTPRAVALLHGGWRGIAAGVLEAGIAALQRLGAVPDGLYLHIGPAICGACYEVGPEVPAGLGLDTAGAVTHVDLRAALVQRARACGVTLARISVSTWCTRHGGTAGEASDFYSHRAGSAERQIAVLGIRGSAG
jgi:polyphenol oxidase